MSGTMDAPTLGAWRDESALPLIFSGHESFAIRHGWIPKLHQALSQDPETFASDERAILTLGLGRNMVKSIRFWGDALGLAETRGRETRPTTFARRLLDEDGGRDPYLEDAGSLWRLHWMLCARSRLGTWRVAFVDLQDAEVTRARLHAMVLARAQAAGGSVSASTASAHLDILIRTYDADRAAAELAPEDALGCPLQDLGLVRSVSHGGVAAYRLPRGPRPSLDVGALAFALADYWAGVAPGSRTLSLRSLSLGRRSPGAVFRLDETSMHGALDALCARTRRLSLVDDGTGGLDLVCRGEMARELEGVAW